MKRPIKIISARCELDNSSLSFQTASLRTRSKAQPILKRVGCTFLYKFQLRFQLKLIS
ncbi:hypothetical protein FRX31_023736, partial [Thalictrum thalictroides]